MVSSSSGEVAVCFRGEVDTQKSAVEVMFCARLASRVSPDLAVENWIVACRF